MSALDDARDYCDHDEPRLSHAEIPARNAEWDRRRQLRIEKGRPAYRCGAVTRFDIHGLPGRMTRKDPCGWDLLERMRNSRHHVLGLVDVSPDISAACARGYHAARRAAMAPVRLPALRDELVEQANADAAAAISTFRGFDSMFGAIFGSRMARAAKAAA